MASLLRKLIREDEPCPPVARDPYERTLQAALSGLRAGCDFQTISSVFRIFAAQQTREGAGSLCRALHYAGIRDAAPAVLATLGLDEERLFVSSPLLCTIAHQSSPPHTCTSSCILYRVGWPPRACFRSS